MLVKMFEEPKMELIAFAAEDVVCTSVETEGPPPMGGMMDPTACVS